MKINKIHTDSQARGDMSKMNSGNKTLLPRMELGEPLSTLKTNSEAEKSPQSGENSNFRAADGGAGAGETQPPAFHFPRAHRGEAKQVSAANSGSCADTSRAESTVYQTEGVGNPDPAGQSCVPEAATCDGRAAGGRAGEGRRAEGPGHDWEAEPGDSRQEAWSGRGGRGSAALRPGQVWAPGPFLGLGDALKAISLRTGP